MQYNSFMPTFLDRQAQQDQARPGCITHRLSLANPLRTLQEGSAERTGPATEEPRPFTRAVLVVEYEEGGPLIREITTVMDKINGRALKGAQGSLRSYRLTTEVSCVDNWAW